MKKLLGKSYIYKLILIFILGSILGYFFETGYYYLKHGVFLNKQGLLYGPFKPIYGFGSVLITMILSKFYEKGYIRIFIYGSILGGIFEYICSLVLEFIFKTKMWHYRNSIFSINGRVYLLYLPFWGIISVLWIKVLIPWLSKLLDKVPNKLLKFFSILITVFIIFDFIISILAVNRMRERSKDIPAKNSYQRFMDKHYSDEFIMKRIPYLKIVD